MRNLRPLLWIGIALLGALAIATIALHRGEQINALWLVTAAVCTYALGYRFYSKFIAAKVLALDPQRPGFRSHQQMGCLRASLRSDSGTWAAGRPGAGCAIRISTWDLMDPRRRSFRRMRPGLRHSSLFSPT